MKKKYVITAPDQNYNPLFYNETIGFTNEISKIPTSMKKAIVICKNSPLSTWIIEYEFPKLKNIAESFIYTFEDFIKSCKSCGLEVIETRPSIYIPSETAPAIPKEEKAECAFVIKDSFGNFITNILPENRGFYNTSNLKYNAKSFRTKKEAEFQAKVLRIKMKDEFSVHKINITDFKR